MPSIRHIAAVPTSPPHAELRCLRCCKVLLSQGAPSTFIPWPGAYCVEVGGRIFANHATARDCEGVDLTTAYAVPAEFATVTG